MIKNSTSTEKKKYPGVCIIKSDHILFHNEEKFIEPLKLNILEILEYSINKPSSPTTQSTVKITTINNIYVFYGWPQAVQRFMYSYVTREIHLARPMSEDINKENCEGFNNKFSASRDNLFKLDQSSGSSLDSGGIDQICNILLSKLKCDNMMVYSGKFDLTVQQLFNLTLEDNMFTKEFRESTGEKEIEHLPWHVDVDGQMVSDSSFKSIVKPFSKEIVTNLRSTITWPSVEGKLYTVHTTSTSSKISMVNSIIVSSYLVMNANPDMESVSLNVFTSIEIKGSAVPHLIIKKSIISMMKSRYNKLEERIKNSLSELKQNLMYNNLDYLPNFHKSLSIKPSSSKWINILGYEPENISSKNGSTFVQDDELLNNDQEKDYAANNYYSPSNLIISLSHLLNVNSSLLYLVLFFSLVLFILAVKKISIRNKKTLIEPGTEKEISFLLRRIANSLEKIVDKLEKFN